MTVDPEHAPWTYVAAYALCADDAQRVLLCRVAPGYDAAGQWTLPGGGLEFGEAPEDGALRELAEETGLRGRVRSLAFVDSVRGGPGSERGQRYGPYHAIRIVYRVEVTGGELRDEPNGSTDRAAWLPAREVDRATLVPLARAALDHLRAG